MVRPIWPLESLTLWSVIRSPNSISCHHSNSSCQTWREKKNKGPHIKQGNTVYLAHTTAPWEPKWTQHLNESSQHAMVHEANAVLSSNKILGALRFFMNVSFFVTTCFFGDFENSKCLKTPGANSELGSSEPKKLRRNIWHAFSEFCQQAGPNNKNPRKKRQHLSTPNAWFKTSGLDKKKCLPKSSGAWVFLWFHDAKSWNTKAVGTC